MFPILFDFIIFTFKSLSIVINVPISAIEGRGVTWILIMVSGT